MNALGDRIRNMLARAIVTLIDDSKGLQTLQVELLADEAQDGVERFGNYGFASRPKAEAEALAACVGGLRSHMVVIAVEDRRYRLRNLAEGEAALYDDLGQVVHLRRNGILMESPLGVTVKAPQVTVEADRADITADTVNLGGPGGKAVARVGDPVSGGVIQSGSTKVKAA